MANEVVKTNQKKELTFSAFMTNNAIVNKVNSIIGDEKSGKRFISGIISAVSVNPQLSECENASILSGALLGEGLNLSPSPQLGHYYLVPFNVKVEDKETKKTYYVKKAQFQLGWKGYYQLALRSGYYKKINVLPIKEGELISWNPLEEEIKVKLIEDDNEREKTKTIGYYAMYEYLNGFKKAIYWSKEKMESHANQYSNGYKAKKGYTFWEKDFDSMAMKTMLRQLISKYGIMSIEMQNAFEGDMAVINEDGSKDYVDNKVEEVEFEIEDVTSKVVSLDEV